MWGNAVALRLPMFDVNIDLPTARYAFPAVIPTVLALAGGWWALWPTRYRAHASAVFVLGMLGLNAVSIWRIWSFYQSLPIA